LFSFILILVKSSTLKLWGLTRWDYRWGAIDSIINNFPAIIKALVDISEEGGGSRSVNAGGLLTHVKKSIFIITSFILHQLFGIIKILSDQLKSKVFVFLTYKQYIFFLRFYFRLCTW
jgi:hypothetical protein